jgi:hypothetical protein
MPFRVNWFKSVITWSNDANKFATIQPPIDFECPKSVRNNPLNLTNTAGNDIVSTLGLSEADALFWIMIISQTRDSIRIDH